MSKTAAAITTLIILAAAVTGYLLWEDSRMPEPQLQPAPPAAEQPAPAEPPATAQEEPEVQYPVEVEEEEEAPPLPALDESDATFRTALSELFGGATFTDLFRPQDIVRRIVVTIDNLPREVVAERLRPIQPVPGRFQIQDNNGAFAIAPDNAQRYARYVGVLERIDAKQFKALYTRFYPLFQSAYRDLGYPNGYFNDRLVAVIDHLLAAPDLEQPVALVQPHVFYRYADPELESASAGHKLMWRIGSKNAARVKAKLREIRAVVTAKSDDKDN